MYSVDEWKPRQLDVVTNNVICGCNVNTRCKLTIFTMKERYVRKLTIKLL